MEISYCASHSGEFTPGFAIPFSESWSLFNWSLLDVNKVFRIKPLTYLLRCLFSVLPVAPGLDPRIQELRYGVALHVS